MNSSRKTVLRGDQVRRYTNTTAYWADYANIVPDEGDVIIYTDGATITSGGTTVNIPRIKIGDGVTALGELPFTDRYVEHLAGQIAESLAAVATSGDYDDLENKPDNAAYGQGIVQAEINNTTTSIAVTFGGYSQKTGGAVSLRFKNNVPAGAKLNINGKGSKPIWYRGAALTAGVIKAGDRCLFMYNANGYYHLLANDRWGVDIAALTT